MHVRLLPRALQVDSIFGVIAGASHSAAQVIMERVYLFNVGRYVRRIAAATDTHAASAGAA
jgi:hypothetical protein